MAYSVREMHCANTLCIGEVQKEHAFLRAAKIVCFRDAFPRFALIIVRVMGGLFELRNALRRRKVKDGPYPAPRRAGHLRIYQIGARLP